MRAGLGIDVGGTFTDVVLIDLETRQVLCSAKSRTTDQDLSLGIAKALGKLDSSLFPSINLVSLSTTLATNAIVQGSRSPITSILIGYREEHCPREFRKGAVLIQGGHDVKGEEAAPLNEKEVLKIIEKTRGRVQAYAVAGYFSSRNPDHELRTKRLIEERTDIPVVCGHELSPKLNAVVRASTTILNAHLIPIIRKLLVSVRAVLSRTGVEVPLMVVKGDGSLVSEEIALWRPIETVLSGPAASVIGAKHLVKTNDEISALVVDVGGTTSDIALVHKGMPRLNSTGVRVGQWTTNVVAIDTLTIGLGGDSHIQCDVRGRLTIGPKRVIPLSILAHQFPGVTEELARIARTSMGPTKYPQGDHWVTYREWREGRLTGAQKALLSLVHAGPQSIFRLARDLDLHPTLVLEELRPLEESGLILRSGFTPTDVFHLSGRYSRGDREAAMHGASILAQQAALDIEGLCLRVRELFNTKLGLEILRRVSTDTMDYQGGMEGCPSCQAIWDNCFAETSGKGARRPKQRFRVQIKLKDPIIGLGAPAHILIPPLAEKFETPWMVPPHAEVANALGAITGVVMVTGEVTLIPEETGRIHVYSVSHRGVYDTFEEADREAKRSLRKNLTERARKAGASRVEIRLEEHAKRAKTAFGDMLIEKLITGKAIGTPAIDDNDAPKIRE